MKTLKRTLALVLVLALSVSFFAFGASADFSDADTIEYTDEVSILTGLGIIAGFEDGSFQPTGDVTRAQMAKLIAYALLGADDAEDLTAGSVVFTDVPAGHWAAGYILFCKNMGIINGYGDGTFGPNDNVTGYQIAKMILCTLGYGQNDEYTGTNWTANVSKKALTLDLFDGNLAGLSNSPANREEACLYLWNGLNISTVSYDGDNGYDKDDVTLAEKNYDLVTATGMITANAATDADYQADADKDVKATTHVQCANSDDGISDDYTIDTGLDLFGHTVTVYYKEDHPETAYAIADKTKVSAAVTMPKADNNKTDERAAVLSSAGFKVSSADDDADIKVYVSDGYADFGGTLKTLDELAAKTTYIFISDDSDKEPAYAIKVSEQLYKVDKLNATSEILTVKNFAGNPVNIDYDDVTSGLDTIAKGDYVVGTQINGDFWSFVVAETVTGAVTSVSASSGTIYIDGTKYVQSAASLGTVALDSDVKDLAAINKDYIYDEISTTIYLDSAGNFMMVVKNEADTQNDVVVVYDGVNRIAMDADGTGVNNSYVKALTLDGTQVTYLTAEDKENDYSNYTDEHTTLMKVSVDSDGIATLTAIASTGTSSGGTTYYANNIKADVTGFETTSTSLNVDFEGKTDTKAYVNSTTQYIFIKYDSTDKEFDIKVVTGGINSDLDKDLTTVLASKSGSTYVADAVLVTDSYSDAGVEADSILYFNDVTYDSFTGYYNFVGYNCDDGSKHTYAVKNFDDEDTLDGFYSYTVADDIYSLTPKTTADTYLTGAVYSSYYGTLLTTTETVVTDGDAANAAIVDTRSDADKKESTGHYKNTITTVSDMDVAADLGYVVTMSILMDPDENDVLAIFVISAEASDACAITEDGTYCTDITGSTVTVATGTTANNLTISDGATISVVKSSSDDTVVLNSAELSAGNVITVTAKDGTTTADYTVAIEA